VGAHRRTALPSLTAAARAVAVSGADAGQRWSVGQAAFDRCIVVCDPLIEGPELSVEILLFNLWLRCVAPEHRMPTPESPPAHRGRRFRAGADRFHITRSNRPAVRRNIADTFSVDNSR
jgi:hypothetical protein